MANDERVGYTVGPETLLGITNELQDRLDYFYCVAAQATQEIFKNIADKWCSQEAVEFKNKVLTNMKSYKTYLEKVFNTLIVSINVEFRIWLETTGNNDDLKIPMLHVKYEEPLGDDKVKDKNAMGQIFIDSSLANFDIDATIDEVLIHMIGGGDGAGIQTRMAEKLKLIGGGQTERAAEVILSTCEMMRRMFKTISKDYSETFKKAYEEYSQHAATTFSSSE